MTLGTRVAQTESAAGKDEVAGLHGAKLRARKSGSNAWGPAGARSQPPPPASHCQGAWGRGCPWGPQQPGQEPGCISHPGTRSNRPLSTRAARRYGTSWVLPCPHQALGCSQPGPFLPQHDAECCPCSTAHPPCSRIRPWGRPLPSSCWEQPLWEGPAPAAAPRPSGS